MTTTKLLSIPEFAKATGLSDRLARHLVKNGDVPSIKVGSRRRVDARFIDRWTAAACEVPAQRDPAMA